MVAWHQNVFCKTKLSLKAFKFSFLKALVNVEHRALDYLHFIYSRKIDPSFPGPNHLEDWSHSNKLLQANKMLSCDTGVIFQLAEFINY